MRTVNVRASCGYLDPVERVLAGKQPRRALTLAEQVMVAHRVLRDGGDLVRIATLLNVGSEIALGLSQADIQLAVPMDAVRCVVCWCTGGVLVVGKYVLHHNRKCDLLPYVAPVQRWRPVHWAEKRRAA